MGAVLTQPQGRPHALPRLTPAVAVPAALGAIWSAVVFAGTFSPDLIHGSEQEHLPLAALTWWFWASLASAFVLVPLAVHRRRDPARGELWFGLVCVTSASWLAAALLSIFTERHLTGSDPTQFPIAAVVAPIAAMIVTACVAGLVSVLLRSE
jgi:hypothetical protein